MFVRFYVLAPEGAPAAGTPAPTPTPAPTQQQGGKAPETPAGKGSPTPHQTPAQGGKEPSKEEIAAALPETLELKINGRMRRVTRDEAVAYLSRELSAEEKFQQASQKEQKASSLKERMSKDFIEALQDPELGLSRDQIRERFEAWYHETFILPQTMTEEQRQALEWKKKAEAYEKEKQEREEREKTAAQQKQDAQTRQELQQTIIDCIEKSGLPKTRFTASRIAFWMKQNIRKGYDAPVDVIVQQVKDEYLGVNQAAVGALKGDPDRLVEWIVSNYGEDVIKAIRKYDVKRLKERLGGGEQPRPAETNRDKGRIPMRKVDEYFNSLRRSKR